MEKNKKDEGGVEEGNVPSLTVKPAQWERPGEQKLQGRLWHKQPVTWRDRSVYLHSAKVMYICLFI